MDIFAPGSSKTESFVVKNISPQIKTINIFQYPINYNTTRDLLKIPGVSSDDIVASLLKGELRHKILAKDIIVIYSDIDILQFNANQMSFLQSAGIVNGLQVGVPQFQILKEEDIQLVGNVNGINTIYTIPSGTFIQEPPLYKIIVYLNGVKQFYTDDYFIAESGGVGTGYDTVIFTIAPQIIPSPPDVITADYYINNT